jgi:hypothetical protein
MRWIGGLERAPAPFTPQTPDTASKPTSRTVGRRKHGNARSEAILANCPVDEKYFPYRKTIWGYNRKIFYFR